MKIYDAPHNFARVEEHDICPTLIARAGTGGGNVPLVLGSAQANAAILDDDTCPTLTAQMGTGGNNMPLVLQEAYRISSDASNVMRSANPLTGFKQTDLSPTLDTVDPSPSKAQGGLAIVVAENVIGRSETNEPQGKGWPEDKCFTLNSTGVHAVLPPHVFKLRSGCEGGGKGYLGQDDKSFTLATGNDQYMMTQARVRKLTPTECERLQGFPDGWTKIPYRGKSEDQCPDSPRYKAIGNSWAVPCVRWIGERIDKEAKK